MRKIYFYVGFIYIQTTFLFSNLNEFQKCFCIEIENPLFTKEPLSKEDFFTEEDFILYQKLMGIIPHFLQEQQQNV